MGRLRPGQDRTVLAGLSLYSQSLAAHFAALKW
jgi:hypothetical protein